MTPGRRLALHRCSCERKALYRLYNVNQGRYVFANFLTNAIPDRMNDSRGMCDVTDWEFEARNAGRIVSAYGSIVSHLEANELRS